jgi:hypothetical protein
MDITHVFPNVIIFLFILAALASGIGGKWNDCIYSVTAAILNIVVFWKPFS